MLLLAGLMLGFAAFVAAEVVTFPQRRRELTLKRAAAYGVSRRETPEDELPRFKERVLVPAVEQLAAAALRVNPKTSVDAIGSRLVTAGLTSRVTTSQFLALKTAAAAGGVLLSFVAGVAFAGATGLLLMPILGMVGFKAPDAVLSMKIKSRRERIRAELPDALDLLAVAVEAGLGLDGAIAKLTEHMDGALVEEFALTLGEMRIGEARPDALKKLADRVPAPEVAAFVRSVLQADQLGISLGRILRVQAADSRLRRQAAAEEKAMKAPIKMLFPTALFIFPAMFVVVLGPAMLNINHYLNFGK
jgi:tight adherence protein C